MKELIEDTIKRLDLYKPEVVELLLGTCAQESAFGKYRRQLGGGPALGIFQCEPATFNDIIENFLVYKSELMAKIIKISGVSRLNAKELIENDILATCIARVHYLRRKEAIPKDLEGQARYWKQYYNTPKGKGTVEEYIRNYKKYVLKKA